MIKFALGLPLFALLSMATACDSPPTSGNSNTVGGTPAGVSGGASGYLTGGGGSLAFEAGPDLTSDAAVQLQPDASASLVPKQDFVVTPDNPRLDAPVLARSGSTLAMAYEDDGRLYVSVSPDGSPSGLSSNSLLVSASGTPIGLFESPDGFLLLWSETSNDGTSTVTYVKLARLAADGSLTQAPLEVSELSNLDFSLASNGSQVLFVCENSQRTEQSALLCDVNGCGSKLVLPKCAQLYGASAVARRDHFDVITACGSSDAKTETLQRVSVSSDGASVSSPQILLQESSTSADNRVVPGLTPGLIDDGDKVWVAHGSPLVLSAFSDGGQPVGSSIILDAGKVVPSAGTLRMTRTSEGWLILDIAVAYGGCDGCSTQKPFLIKVDTANSNAVTLSGDLAIFPPALVKNVEGSAGILAWQVGGLGSSRTIGFAPTDSVMGLGPPTPTLLFRPLQAALILGQTCDSNYCWVLTQELTSPLQPPQQFQLSWHTIDRASHLVSQTEIAKVARFGSVLSTPVSNQGTFLVVSPATSNAPMQLISTALGQAGTISNLTGEDMYIDHIFLDSDGLRLFGRDWAHGNPFIAKVSGSTLTKEYAASSLSIDSVIQCEGRYFWNQVPTNSSGDPLQILAVYEPSASPEPAVVGHYPIGYDYLFPRTCDRQMLASSLETPDGQGLVVLDVTGKTVAQYGRSPTFGYMSPISATASNKHLYLLDSGSDNGTLVLRAIDDSGNMTIQLLTFPAYSPLGWLDCSSNTCSLQIADGEVRLAWRDGTSTRLTIWPLQ